MKKAVLLNDTSYANHFGCRYVCENIKSAFRAKCDTEIISTYEISKNLNYTKLDELDFDYIVINGEGTIHSGRETGLKLLQVVERYNKPVFLINALYENNPDSWLNYLNKMTLISVQDEASYNILNGKITTPLFLTSDISLYGESYISRDSSQRTGIYIGDSVVKSIRDRLYTLAKKTNSFYMPIYSDNKYGRNSFSISIIKLKLKALMYSKFLLLQNQSSFIAKLQEAELFITGRFHGVCLAIKTKTPFLTFTSNTKKIEVMLKTIGLEDRLLEDINENVLKSRDWGFSKDELEKIDIFLKKSNQKWDIVFAKINEVVNEKS